MSNNPNCNFRRKRSFSMTAHNRLTCFALFQSLACLGLLESYLVANTVFLRHLPGFSSVTQSCPTFCDPMNRSTPGLPVHHQLPESTQTHVRWVSDCFVGKAISLLFNMLSRLVVTFLPRSKRLLISWLQSPSAVILEPPKIKSATFPVFPHLFTMRWWDWMPWS